ncbi:hypothetical protein Dimus_028445 [Dionaea muscipula]
MCPSGASTSSNHHSTPELREAFNVLDADRDGKISKDDLLRTFYASSSSDDDGGHDLVGTMISVADSDKDGYVQFHEFERVLDVENDDSSPGRSRGGGGGMMKERIMEEAFKLMDRDGDGRLGYDDLKAFLELGGLSTADEDIRVMIRLGGATAERDGVSFDMLLKILAI